MLLKKRTPSACAVGVWRGLQDSGDGRTTILDSSGKGNHLVLGAAATYSAVVGTNAGYCTIVGTASASDKTIQTPTILTWDMYAGQSLILFATVKAALPGSTVQLFNARGSAGNLQGFSLLFDTAGKPSVVVRDSAGTSFISVVPTDVFLDGTDHKIIVGIDGTGKKAYIWKDGTAVSNTGQAITATGGSTQGDDPARWGGNGDVTWVSGANLQIRHMHLYVMPYWPSNITTIVAELGKNYDQPLPARMLPATASA